MLPKRCHFGISSLTNGSVKPFVWASALLPLNSRRRLTCYIVNNAVNVSDLVYDADGNLFENVVWDTREIGGHKVGCRNAAERERVIIRSAVAHNAD